MLELLLIYVFRVEVSGSCNSASPLFLCSGQSGMQSVKDNVKYIMCCWEFRVSIQFTVLLLPQEVENPAPSSARSFLYPVIDGRMI